MSKSRRRHEEHEEHVNHERWLVSYADMMTLLMVLFIVMFAISQVDQRKFDQLKDGMAAGFGATASPFQGSEGTLSGDGAKPLQPVGPDAAKPDSNIGMESPSESDSKASASAASKSQTEVSKDSTEYQHAASEVTQLQSLRKAIEKALAKRHYQRDVSIKIDEQGLTVSLVSRHIVFRANEAALSTRGQQVLDVLAPVIRSLPNHVNVDGHTNQVKVKPKYYPTDWELSAARAVTVLRYLNEHGRVPAIRMTAVAFGHERPLRDPALPGAAALNKRVDLVVVSDSPESTRRLFTQVLRDRHEST
jgi:chemotaxis protein MotB